VSKSHMAVLGFLSALAFLSPQSVQGDDLKIELRPNIGHANWAKNVRFSLTGTTLITADNTGKILVWDVATGRELRELRGHVDDVDSIVVIDKKHVLTGSLDGTVRIWDLASGIEEGEVGEENSQRESDWVNATAFDRTRGTIWIGGRRRYTSLSRWNMSDSEPPSAVEHANAEISAIAVSPDGEWVAAQRDEGTDIYALPEGRFVRRLPFSGTTVAFSPDSTEIATGGIDGKLARWSTRTWKAVTQLPGVRDNAIWDIAYAPDGKTLYAADGAGNIRSWSVREFVPKATFVGDFGAAYGIALSPDGTQLACAYENGIVVLWDVNNGQQIRQFASALNSNSSMSLAANDERLAVGNAEGSVWTWFLEDTHAPTKREIDLSAIDSVALSRDGELLATASAGRASIWALDEAGGPICSIHNDGVDIMHMSFSPTQDIFAATGKIKKGDKTRGVGFIANAHTCAIASQVPESDYDSSVLAFRQDGKVLALGNIDHTVTLYTVPTGKQVHRYGQTEGGVYGAGFSADGAEVYGMGVYGQIEVWNAGTGLKDRRMTYPYTTNIEGAAFSANGRAALAGRFDQSALLWDLNTGSVSAVLHGHRDIVDQVAMSSDGRLGITTSRDGVVNMWSVPHGDLMLSLLGFRNGGWAVVSPSGRFDTDDIDQSQSLSWVASDEPFHPLPIEIFMRDYYEPRLLPRLLECYKARQEDSEACAREFPQVPSLRDLNRVQPGVKILSVKRGSRSDVAEVTVEVSPAEGQFQRDGKPVTMKTDVYDLRLFRQGQLVGQEPELSLEAEAKLKNGVVLTPEELEHWKTARKMKPIAGRVELDVKTGKLTRTFEVRLPHGQAGREIDFTAYAFNEDRVKSETDKETYTVPADAGPVRRRAYVIAMGANAYENPDWDLRFAASDATVLQQALVKRLQGQYEVVPVTLISDCKVSGCPEGHRDIGKKDATKASLHAVLELLAGHPLSGELKQSLPPGAEQIKQKAEPDDLVMISVSSHGYTTKEGMFYMIPSDSGNTEGVGLTKEQLNQLEAKWISSDELSAWLRDVDAGEMVMVVDTCHSAATVEEPGFKPGPMGSRGLGQLAYDKGMRILAASQANDVALESEKLKQGLLTYALVENGLEDGQAVKPGTEQITLDSWLDYGSERVPKLYEEVVQGKVTRITDHSKDVTVDVELSGGASTLNKPSAFQQPSLFNFQRHPTGVLLQ
jgi:WD40 repeat protein